jgi:hypothetical protein
MIYTCYEMIRDCRANKPEGWIYFISNYVPVIRKLLAHYGGGEVETVLRSLRQPESSLFQSLDPAPERWFVAELRQRVVGAANCGAAEASVDLEILSEALGPLTFTEKQATWLETMRYSAAETGAMLRMAPATVEKIRAKAAESLRGKMDSWSRNILLESGAALGQAAAAVRMQECLNSKTFLDVLDGRTTWSGRDALEQHAARCWHCIDHFCRMAEVIELLRGVKPLTDAEAEPYRKLLGVETPKRRWWRK